MSDAPTSDLPIDLPGAADPQSPVATESKGFWSRINPF